MVFWAPNLCLLLWAQAWSLVESSRFLSQARRITTSSGPCQRYSMRNLEDVSYCSDPSCLNHYSYHGPILTINVAVDIKYLNIGSHVGLCIIRSCRVRGAHGRVAFKNRTLVYRRPLYRASLSFLFCLGAFNGRAGFFTISRGAAAA